MKLKHSMILASAALIGVWSCSDPDMPTPAPVTTPGAYSANFLLINASPDAPSLDLYINNVKSGESVAAGETQATYVKSPITSNGVFANTNIRAKASSGTIGGTLQSADLIFRAGNNNQNNFQVVDSATYTVIVVDSLTRPKPIRTTNADGFGDTTFLNPLTGKLIGTQDKAALSATEKSKLVPIGIVPLGATDPGGIRFLVIQDQLPLPATSPRLPKPAAAKAAVRFINASPDAGTVTVAVDAANITGGTLSFPFKFPAFSPSVGSRSTSTGTTALTYNTWNTIDSGVHSIVVKVGATEVARLDGVTFDEKSDYTIVMSGYAHVPGSLKLTVAKNK